MFNGCAALVVETVRLLSNNILSKPKTNFIFQDVTDAFFNAVVVLYCCCCCSIFGIQGELKTTGWATWFN